MTSPPFEPLDQIPEGGEGSQAIGDPNQLDPIDTAIVLARLGIPVLPFRGKAPATRHGYKDATTDERQLRSMIRPGMNIGIATGGSLRLLGLDVDVRAGKNGFDTLAELEAKHGPLPATLRVNTGSGGCHIYLALPEGISIGNSVEKLGPGLDIKCEGGCLLTPPSIHPETGEPYLWGSDPETTHIAQAPEWLILLLKKPSNLLTPPGPPPADTKPATRYGEVVLDQETRAVAETGEGARNDRLNRAAFRVGQLSVSCGISWQTASYALVEAAVAAGLTRDEAWSTFKSGWKAGLDEPDVPPRAGMSAPVQMSAQSVAHKQEVAEMNMTQAAFTPISAADLDAMEFPPAKYVIPGYAPVGLIVLAGKPKMGKSWLALGLAIAVAAGGYALGSIPVEQGEVLYLGLEDHLPRLQDRMRKILGPEQAPAHLLIARAIPRLDEGGLAIIAQHLSDRPNCRMIFIDTLARFKPPGKSGVNSYEQDYQIMGCLQSLAIQREVAIVVVTHLRKQQDTSDVFDAVTGSIAITGAADCTWVLDRKRADADAILSVTGRDIEEREVALKFDHPTGQWFLLGEGSDHLVSPQRREILDLLRQSEVPLGPTELADTLGRKPGNIRYLLNKMVKDGEVSWTGRGQYQLPATANNTNDPNIQLNSAVAEPSALSANVAYLAPGDALDHLVSDASDVSGLLYEWEDDA